MRHKRFPAIRYHLIPHPGLRRAAAKEEVQVLAAIAVAMSLIPTPVLPATSMAGEGNAAGGDDRQLACRVRLVLCTSLSSGALGWI
jgi:hypothetical protein